MRKSRQRKSPADSGAAELQTSSSVNISPETVSRELHSRAPEQGDVRADGRFGPCATFNSILLNLKKFKMYICDCDNFLYSLIGHRMLAAAHSDCPEIHYKTSQGSKKTELWLPGDSCHIFSSAGTRNFLPVSSGQTLSAGLESADSVDPPSMSLRRCLFYLFKAEK